MTRGGPGRAAAGARPGLDGPGAQIEHAHRVPQRPGLLGRIACVVVGLIVTACAGAPPARQPRPSAPAASSGAAAAPLSLDALLALNPALNGSGYRLQSGPEPGLSTWTGPAGGRLDVVVNGNRTVVAVRGVFPTSTGLQPWYDQAGAGTAAAQTGGAAPLSSGSATAPYPVASDSTPRTTSSAGAVTSNDAPLVGASSATSATTVYTETIWLVARAAASTGPAGLPQYAAVAKLNPGLSRARAQSDFVPGAGVYYGPRGYGLLAMVDRAGRLVGLTGWFPPGAGWRPYYDQMPGHEDMAPQWFLRGYTQHLWLASPAGVR